MYRTLRVFTKFFSMAATFLCSEGIRVFPYLDNWLLLVAQEVHLETGRLGINTIPIVAPYITLSLSKVGQS